MNTGGEVFAVGLWLVASAWAARTMFVTLKDDPEMNEKHGAALPIACFGTALIAWPWVAYLESKIALRRFVLVWRFRLAMGRAVRNVIADAKAHARTHVRQFEEALLRIK